MRTEQRTPIQTYKWLGGLVNDARLAGFLDWKHLEDRIRKLESVTHWDSPDHIVNAAAETYAENKWVGQKNYVEVWIEKDALVGVIEAVCKELDVPYFACRGYVSQSEMWGAAQRIIRKLKKEDYEKAWILHLGDHDPSGIDMSRDTYARLKMFVGISTPATRIKVRRLALNMAQIEAMDPPPPPNPAKVTDARYQSYREEYGDESWELDALEPSYIVGAIRRGVGQLIDQNLWDEREADQEENRELLSKVSTNIDRVREFMEGF